MAGGWLRVCPKDEMGPGLNGVPIEFNLEVDEYPSVDGSTSTHPLAVLIASKVLGVPCYWQDYPDYSRRIRAVDETPEIEDVADAINGRLVDHHGTHGSYVALIEGHADLILVARQPSEDELELAGNHSVELVAEPVALDAFVFLLNRANPVSSLTVKQIQDIYTGNITNWSSVGGLSNNISAYLRNPNSGSQELMKRLVMKDLEMINTSDMILWGMSGPINTIGWDENGTGYSVYFYEEFMQPHPNIKLCGVNGVVPSYDTIMSRQYVFTSEVYAVVRGDLDSDSTTYALMEWLLSEEGQAVVKESGYVPISDV
jgi:phosphate transport system substrate-binding protein